LTGRNNLVGGPDATGNLATPALQPLNMAKKCLVNGQHTISTGRHVGRNRLDLGVETVDKLLDTCTQQCGELPSSIIPDSFDSSLQNS